MKKLDVFALCLLMCFALLLPVFFGLDGVLYSMPVSDVLTFILSLIVIFYTYRTLAHQPIRGQAQAESK